MVALIIMLLIVVVIIIVTINFKEQNPKSHADAVACSGNRSIKNLPKNPVANKAQGTNNVSKGGSIQQKPASGTAFPVCPSPPKKTSVKQDTPYCIQQIPFLLDELSFDYSIHIYVNYNLNSSEKLEYPYLKVPQKGTEIKLPVRGRSAKRGFCEARLCDVIKEYKLDKFKDNLTLIAADCPYEPDLAYINVDKGIFIDIEVDEPYAGLERFPIHFKTKNGTCDDLRNQRFTERGWIVLRFSEKQVFNQANSCLKYLYQIIHRIDSSIGMPAALENVPDLDMDLMWTEEEAMKKANNKEREKMLGISEFRLSTVSANSGRPSDYEGAEKIENTIKCLRDDDLWEQLSTRKSWGKYIDCFPNGRHTAEAKEKIDDDLWAKCKKDKDYDGYLRQSELQRHAVEAMRIKEKEARIKAEKNRRETERIKAIQEVNILTSSMRHPN